MLNHWLSILQSYRLIGVIRSSNREIAIKKAHALANGGVKLIEITWNSYQPQELISILRQELPNCYIGAGTILCYQDLVTAMDAGIQFCFTPHCDLNLLNLAHNQDIPMIPGALSPTEIIHAFNHGAKVVKVFPISTMGGIDYIKHIRAPLPHIPLIPTGGVTIQNASDYIKAGAIAIGLSTDLFPQKLIFDDNWGMISQRINHIQQQLVNISN
ncbi:bifunctional 4-hydroxy-2-oxoglutarate aldolase/2-dehydro-3-deoxy-phosphogluconate aldolase [Geminocystis sp. NIES-3709]|uniref:bifunctional 4-hydroxy-2-oxoglutarate aldolase/2-dehydro-3-deoxy-phosphogluconate aldolase n=1 Tax=Geminocystis sp. NIES-3709 TaxID=1617448 RepID=UPI0005FC7518|nr:bifunctional 4-hydroxy-2-oxoglutarate aldolase/2-dehydro-3-deoxy-phosphogluconate aldolase [Geminocystis sp. NIES-3709]BAQ64523.1 4-Hydroxy-2-oxoglutarate aldolase [Geminocystis sp. NIES-3709]